MLLLKLSPWLVALLLVIVLILRFTGVIDSTTSSFLSLTLATIALGIGISQSLWRKRRPR